MMPTKRIKFTKRPSRGPRACLVGWYESERENLMLCPDGVYTWWDLPPTTKTFDLVLHTTKPKSKYHEVRWNRSLELYQFVDTEGPLKTPWPWLLNILAREWSNKNTLYATVEYE